MKGTVDPKVTTLFSKGVEDVLDQLQCWFSQRVSQVDVGVKVVGIGELRTGVSGRRVEEEFDETNLALTVLVWLPDSGEATKPLGDGAIQCGLALLALTPHDLDSVVPVKEKETPMYGPPRAPRGEVNIVALGRSPDPARFDTDTRDTTPVPTGREVKFRDLTGYRQTLRIEVLPELPQSFTTVDPARYTPQWRVTIHEVIRVHRTEAGHLIKEVRGFSGE